jgi:hypothetical protein
MSEQTTYSTAPILEEKGLQWYCPNHFSISGHQYGCMKGIWPLQCHKGCPYEQWVEYTMTSTSIGVPSETEEKTSEEENVEHYIKYVFGMEGLKKGYNLVEVYDIDGHLCIGKEIEDAIAAYKEFYPTGVIKKITKVFGEGDKVGNAIMLKEKP